MFFVLCQLDFTLYGQPSFFSVRDSSEIELTFFLFVKMINGIQIDSMTNQNGA